MHLNVIADNGIESGFGHVSRCMVLAAEFSRRGVDVTFMLDHDNAVEMIAASGQFSTILNPAPESLFAADLLLIDSYLRDENFYATAADCCDASLIVIDDFGDRELDCTVYINHNLFAHDLDFSMVTAEHKFLGPGYALVAPDYHAIGAARRASSDTGDRNNGDQEILISFGGADKGQWGWQVASAIRAVGIKTPITVISPPKQDARQLENCVCVERIDICSYLDKCALYVCGAGQSSLEACASQQPFLPVILADNQRPNARALQDAGVLVIDSFCPDKIVGAIAHFFDNGSKFKGLDLPFDKGLGEIADIFLGAGH